MILIRRWAQKDAGVLLASVALLVGMVSGVSCGGNTKVAGTLPGTVAVSISDPPSCMPPNGSFTHVFVTIRSVQAHIDPKADDSSSGWQELAPQLANQPLQIDLVVLTDNSIHQLALSSQDNTGLKIPPGQIVGGPLQVSAGQSVDLNIDFDACASIVTEGNGTYRLKPTLTAGRIARRWRTLRPRRTAASRSRLSQVRLRT